MNSIAIKVRNLPITQFFKQTVCRFSVSGKFPSEPVYSDKYGWQITISPLKKLSVRKWQDMILIDLRTYWDPNNDGNLVPTKRGIALTEQQWESFVSHRLDIEKLLELTKTDNKTELPQESEPKDLFSCVY